MHALASQISDPVTIFAFLPGCSSSTIGLQHLFPILLTWQLTQVKSKWENIHWEKPCQLLSITTLAAQRAAKPLHCLKKKGISPDVVKYLEQTPSVDQLKILLSQLGFNSAREMMRTKEVIYKELALGEENVTEQQLFEAMAANPKLIERPIVVKGDKAAMGRPPEQVLDIL